MRNDIGLQLLGKISEMSDRLVMTYIVEMEFKKHRQSAIVETLKNIKQPEKISRPLILAKNRAYESVVNAIEKASNGVKSVRSDLHKIMLNPLRRDPVYAHLQRMFKKNDKTTLTRDTKQK